MTGCLLAFLHFRYLLMHTQFYSIGISTIISCVFLLLLFLFEIFYIFSNVNYSRYLYICIFFINSISHGLICDILWIN